MIEYFFRNKLNVWEVKVEVRNFNRLYKILYIILFMDYMYDVCFFWKNLDW